MSTPAQAPVAADRRSPRTNMCALPATPALAGCRWQKNEKKFTRGLKSKRRRPLNNTNSSGFRV